MTTFGITKRGKAIRHIFKDGRDGLCGARHLISFGMDAPVEMRHWPLCKRCEKSSQRTHRKG